jgi:hypothetical protein
MVTAYFFKSSSVIALPDWAFVDALVVCFVLVCALLPNVANNKRHGIKTLVIFIGIDVYMFNMKFFFGHHKKSGHFFWRLAGG